MAGLEGEFTCEEGQWMVKLNAGRGSLESGLKVFTGNDYHIVCIVESIARQHRDMVESAVDDCIKTAGTVEEFIECVSRTGVDVLIAGQLRGTPVLWRGPAGVLPLYRSKSKGSIYFSTSWRALFDEAPSLEPVLPGRLFDGGPSRNVASLDMLMRNGTDKDFEGILCDAIGSAVKMRYSKNTGLMFSGGLDSVLLASYLPTCPLLAVGLHGSHDLRSAREAAIQMGRHGDLVEVELSLKELKNHVDDVKKMVHLPSRMDIELGVVMLTAVRECAGIGIKTLISGQGADELFGGYARYERLAAGGDMALLGREMRSDVLRIWMGLDRDNSIAQDTGIELRFPYLDRMVIKIALSIPPDMKVRVTGEAGKEYIRKFQLRKVADHRLPDELAWKPKRAMQYGSGVHRALAGMEKRGEFRVDGK